MTMRASHPPRLAALLLCSLGLPGLACDDDDGDPADAATSDAREAGGADTTTADRPVDAPAPDGPGADRLPDASADVGPDAAPLTAQQERGRYLVENVIACPECHTPRLADGRLDASKYMAGDTACFVKLPNNDCIYARNLTPHPTGLGNRTDADIKKMFMEGLRPDATGEVALHPIMPYYVFGNMDPEDADAIVAFLKTLPPVANTIPPKGASFNVEVPAPAITLGDVPTPADDYPNQAAAARGRYLAAQTGLCVECHTPHVMGGETALDETKFFQGGEEFPVPFGTMTLISRSKNLTPDTVTGLGSWSVDDIVQALKQGKDKMDKGLCPPMPAGPMASYGGLTAQDARDIAHYLKSIPAATNMVNDVCSFPPGQ